MIPWLVALPILVPFVTAILAFLAGRSLEVKRWISVAGAAVLLAVGLLLIHQVYQHGILVGAMGNWPPPFGIALVVDFLSAIMVAITGITGLAVAVYALADVDRAEEHVGFHPLFHLLLGGVCGAFTTGDLFNLYVWFEVMLISSFALLVLGSRKAQIDGAVKYVALNLVSTVLFLIAVGLLYGMTGTLNMADLHLTIPQVENQGLVTAVALMFIVAFGIKSAVFPLFFWLPAAYHTPSVSVSAIFSALLTKVGVYALIRVFTLIFTEDVAYTHTLLLIIAGVTMLTGVLGAAAQNEFRRILSFHIVSQIGYMIMGLALYTPLGVMGAVFYVVHHIIVKANLFLVSGVANRLTGSFELKKIGGLYKSQPFVAVLFLVPAFSLAGFPPLSGFWAKLVLVQAGLEIDSYLIVATALLVGLLTIYSMTKIWNEAFWKPHPDEIEPGTGAVAVSRRDYILLTAPIAGMAALTVIIGLWTEPFILLATSAAEQLLNPDAYVQAVLGVRP